MNECPWNVSSFHKILKNMKKQNVFSQRNTCVEDERASFNDKTKIMNDE